MSASGTPPRFASGPDPTRRLPAPRLRLWTGTSLLLGFYLIGSFTYGGQSLWMAAGGKSPALAASPYGLGVVIGAFFVAPPVASAIAMGLTRLVGRASHTGANCLMFVFTVLLISSQARQLYTMVNDPMWMNRRSMRWGPPEAEPSATEPVPSGRDPGERYERALRAFIEAGALDPSTLDGDDAVSTRRDLVLELRAAIEEFRQAIVALGDGQHGFHENISVNAQVELLQVNDQFIDTALEVLDLLETAGRRWRSDVAPGSIWFEDDETRGRYDLLMVKMVAIKQRQKRLDRQVSAP